MILFFNNNTTKGDNMKKSTIEKLLIEHDLDIEKQNDKEMIQFVYTLLKERTLDPSGDFDKAGRFYAEHDDLIAVREPSRAWPYSHMLACRTKKYVKKVKEKFDCSNVFELINLV